MQKVIHDCATGGQTVVNLTPQEVADLRPNPTEAQYAGAIQSRLDGIARDRGYGNAASLTSYVSSTLPQWAAEARAFVAWRDQVWTYAYGELAKVQAGKRTAPGVAEFLDELPQIQWPQEP